MLNTYSSNFTQNTKYGKWFGLKESNCYKVIHLASFQAKGMKTRTHALLASNPALYSFHPNSSQLQNHVLTRYMVYLFNYQFNVLPLFTCSTKLDFNKLLVIYWIQPMIDQCCLLSFMTEKTYEELGVAYMYQKIL